MPETRIFRCVKKGGNGEFTGVRTGLKGRPGKVLRFRRLGRCLLAVAGTLANRIGGTRFGFLARSGGRGRDSVNVLGSCFGLFLFRLAFRRGRGIVAAFVVVAVGRCGCCGYRRGHRRFRCQRRGRCRCRCCWKSRTSTNAQETLERYRRFVDSRIHDALIRTRLFYVHVILHRLLVEKDNLL